MKKLAVVAVIGMVMTQTAHAGWKDVLFRTASQKETKQATQTVAKKEYRPTVKIQEQRVAPVLFSEGDKIDEAGLRNYLLNYARGLHKPATIIDRDVAEGYIKVSAVEIDGMRSIVIETKGIDYREMGRFEAQGSYISDRYDKAQFLETVIPMTPKDQVSFQEIDEISRIVSNKVVTMVKKLDQEYIAKQLASARNNSLVLSRKNVDTRSAVSVEIEQRLNSVSRKAEEARPTPRVAQINAEARARLARAEGSRRATPSNVQAGSDVKELLDSARTRTQKPKKPEVTHAEATRRLLDVSPRILQVRPAQTTTGYGDAANQAMQRAVRQESRSAK